MKSLILFLILLTPSLSFAAKCFPGSMVPEIAAIGPKAKWEKAYKNSIGLKFKGMPRWIRVSTDSAVKHVLDLIKINLSLPKNERQKWCMTLSGWEFDSFTLGHSKPPMIE